MTVLAYARCHFCEGSVPANAADAEISTCAPLAADLARWSNRSRDRPLRIVHEATRTSGFAPNSPLMVNMLYHSKPIELVTSWYTPIRMRWRGSFPSRAGWPRLCGARWKLR